jgi:hypothetical protein
MTTFSAAVSPPVAFTLIADFCILAKIFPADNLYYFLPDKKMYYIIISILIIL